MTQLLGLCTAAATTRGGKRQDFYCLSRLLVISAVESYAYLFLTAICGPDEKGLHNPVLFLSSI
uniref:Uncharacterized protein n=1 Tax=Arundo donax TaxID=35708 RepID=A0A0A9E4E0_ARUDO